MFALVKTQHTLRAGVWAQYVRYFSENPSSSYRETEFLHGRACDGVFMAV